MADADQRTEKPTKRRIAKSREQGRFASSREVVQATQFLVFVVAASGWGSAWLDAVVRLSRRVFTLGFEREFNPARFTYLFSGQLFAETQGLLLAGGAMVLGGLAAQLASTQLGVSGARLKPDFTRLNPISRLAGLPGQNLMQAAKATVMLPLLIAAVWIAVRSNLEGFLSLPWLGVRPGLALVAVALKRLTWYAALILFLSALLDWGWQKRQLNKTLKMSKQEIRDEHKETEGNPEIKGRIRRAQRELARRNMMKDVASATAVVVNPTHYAVAIRYQMESASAPRVVAKGRNFLALRIRQRAIDCGIPIVENKPLAQALFKAVDVGQEIPPHLYRAVAEILAYIYRLMNGRLPG